MTRFISGRMRFGILAACQFACVYCGRRAPQVELVIDHVRPYVSGGPTAIGNLVAACHNSGKSDGLLHSSVSVFVPDAIQWPSRLRKGAARQAPRIRCDYCERPAARVGLDVGTINIGGLLPECDMRPCCERTGHLHYHTLDEVDDPEAPRCLVHRPSAIPLACARDSCGTSAWYEIAFEPYEDCDTATHLLGKSWLACRQGEIRAAFARVGVTLPADDLWDYPINVSGYALEVAA